MNAWVARSAAYITFCLVCVSLAFWQGSILAEKVYLAKSGFTMTEVQNEPDLREVYATAPGLGTAITQCFILEAIVGVVAGYLCGALVLRVAARLSAHRRRQFALGLPLEEDWPPSPTPPVVSRLRSDVSLQPMSAAELERRKEIH